MVHTQTKNNPYNYKSNEIMIYLLRRHGYEYETLPFKSHDLGLSQQDNNQCVNDFKFDEDLPFTEGPISKTSKYFEPRFDMSNQGVKIVHPFPKSASPRSSDCVACFIDTRPVVYLSA